ncbi:MAG: hypothetical protein QN122_09500 [Armatimonadota bacterium]|nr:hypothetical protein [Armatimonadota bacterium]
MRHALVLSVIGVAVLALAVPSALAAAPATKAPAAAQPRPRSFVVEGKVVKVSGDTFEITVTKVIGGTGVKVGDHLTITERARTRFLLKGKAVNKSALKAGELLRVAGQSYKPAGFEAVTVTILK